MIAVSECAIADMLQDAEIEVPQNDEEGDPMSGDRALREEPLAFLDLLTSIGADRFDVSFLPLDSRLDGRENQAEPARDSSVAVRRPNLTGECAEKTRRKILGLIADADRDQESVVIRPHAPGVQIVQLDDLNAETVFRLNDVLFMVIETSQGRYQGWVAVNEAEAKSGNLFRRLRKGVGCDQTASGATRVPGSRNFKVKRRDAHGNYPMVRLVHSEPGKLVSGEELEATGLLAEPEPVKEAAATGEPISPHKGGQKLPEYAECVRYGKQRGDRDLADQRFAWIAADRGFSPDEVTQAILAVSPKAAEMRDPERRLRYAQRKAQAGADFARQRAARLRGHRMPQNAPKPSIRSATPADTERRSSGHGTLLGEVPRAASPSEQTSAQGRRLPNHGPSQVMPEKEAVEERMVIVTPSANAVRRIVAASGVSGVVVMPSDLPDLRLRCGGKRTIIATRADPEGDALTRRLCEMLTLCSGVWRAHNQEELSALIRGFA